MKKTGSIVTVGLCPSWDMVCQFDSIEWGQHKLVSASHLKPAGKAMNISHALAWMGCKSIAAGLWGRDDYELLKRSLKPMHKFIDLKVTPVEGSTRRNVTVIDTTHSREMHLRHKCQLTSTRALKRLRADLEKIVKRNSICAFAGLVTDAEYLDDVIEIIQTCARKGAQIVLDTSGPALRKIIDTGLIWMVKPNVEEFRELLDDDIPDRPPTLARAAKTLLDKIQIVLISRGAKGAVVVTRDDAWQAGTTKTRKVHATIGCGDYMLAGFLKQLKDSANISSSLAVAIKAGTAMAWNSPRTDSWKHMQRTLPVKISQI